MMRLVRDEVIWLHGSYRFASRQQLYETLARARALLAAGESGAPLSMSCSVVDESELMIIMKIPFFEERDFAASLFGLLARSAENGALELRVDVV
jgi:hypothetical protein